jgi:TonB-dependent starch-binding outer membrane protein SusC
MKLTILIFLITNFISFLNVVAQTISLKAENEEIAKVLASLEKQGVFRFVYNNSSQDLNKKISVNFDKVSINDAFKQIFSGTNLTYLQMENNLIAIKTDEALSGSIKVSGKIKDTNGDVVPGAIIRVKGMPTLGTSSNGDGTYTIDVFDDAILVITSVGYEEQMINVNGRSTIDIILKNAIKALDQVVVIGYGTSRKRDVTGSLVSINGSELAKQPLLTATQAVQGKVAGVQVISSGDPNALPIVRIRGTGTMLGGANPLYVVDGVINDDIRNINSSDILTFEVLKDASATAIYGMRAANGVILITTKKGKMGKMIISYDMSFGIKEATQLVNMASANQYARYVNEASLYYGSGDSIVKQSTLRNGGNTNWYNEILRRGLFQNHNVSLSGGSEKINYFFSAGYLTDEGIIRTNKFDRFTLRNNNDYKISDKFTISTNVSYSGQNVRNIDLNAFNIAYRAAPYVIAKQDDKYGNTSLANNVGNPILDQDKTNNSGNGDRLQGNIVGELRPLNWLTLRTSLGADKNNFRSISYNYKFENQGPNSVFLTSGSNQVRNNSTLSIGESQSNRWVWDNTAIISKVIKEHSFNFLIGTTAERIKVNGLGGTRLDVPEDKDQWYLNAGSTIGGTNFNDGDKSTRNSYLARLNYNFKDKYFLTATGRYDGTSRLPIKNRWGFFPSVGAGWVLSSEPFMQKQKIIDNLKLRASYGKVGNDGIPSNAFTALATQNLPYIFNGIEVLNFRLEQLADPNIKWEVTSETNFGMDFSLLKNKLSGTVDVYSRLTEDALVRIKTPTILGDDEYITNAATFKNKGIELGLDWKANIGQNWKYGIGGNVAFNNNKIENLNGGQAIPDGAVGGQGTTTLSDNGQPIGSFYLLEAIGIFQSNQEIVESAQQGAKLGDLIYRDVDGNKVIDANDRVFQGSYQPKATFGLNVNVSYKSFDLAVAGYGTAGGKIYNGKKAARSDFRDNIEADVVTNHWTSINTNTNVPRANLNELPASTYFLEKGDFFRINNLTLGYNLSSKSLSILRIQTARIYATVQNLATFTKYSGFTPELIPPGNRSSTLAGGIESSIYPSTRTFAFGINVVF